MKNNYSISYTMVNSSYTRKVWDNLGNTKKFNTIDEATKYIDEILIKESGKYINLEKPIKIMQGWNVAKEIYYSEGK